MSLRASTGEVRSGRRACGFLCGTLRIVEVLAKIYASRFAIASSFGPSAEFG
jgi:hypothetical protein